MEKREKTRGGLQSLEFLRQLICEDGWYSDSNNVRTLQHVTFVAAASVAEGEKGTANVLPESLARHFNVVAVPQVTICRHWTPLPKHDATVTPFRLFVRGSMLNVLPTVFLACT